MALQPLPNTRMVATRGETRPAAPLPGHRHRRSGRRREHRILRQRRHQGLRRGRLFTEGRPTKGLAEFSYDWLGATWHFTNAGNRDAFASEPIRYAPSMAASAPWERQRRSLGQHRSGSLADRWRKTLPVRRKGRPGGGLRCSRRAVVAKADVKWPESSRRNSRPAGERQLSVGLQPPTWAADLHGGTSLGDRKVPDGGGVGIDVLAPGLGASAGIAIDRATEFPAESDPPPIACRRGPVRA